MVTRDTQRGGALEAAPVVVLSGCLLHVRGVLDRTIREKVSATT